MVIGIGGVSTSGKSGLARQIASMLPHKKVAVLCMDDYCRPNLPSIRDHVDWEHPSSIDYDRYYDAVLAANATNDVVVAEGIFAFHNERINALYDKTIFLSIDKETFLKRKSIDLRWGKEPEWYMEHIWESYLQYGILPKEIKDSIMLNGSSWSLTSIENQLGI